MKPVEKTVPYDSAHASVVLSPQVAEHLVERLRR